MQIALVEPFFAGSHQRWSEELQRHSSHRINLYTLPGRHWKWRMHGAAITLAQRLDDSDQAYDLILVSDMLDLAVFSSLIRRRYPTTPLALYFHENQLTYPWSQTDEDVSKKRDRHYAFINYTSALTADRVFFNSDYHRQSFLASLPEFLAAYPDFENKGTVQTIADKSETLSLGLELSAFDAFRPDSPEPRVRPLLLWNHRWEYDKDPDAFASLLVSLLDRGLDFEVALLGERFASEPPHFAALRERLGNRVVAYGKTNTFEEYARWLWKADILPVTSRQDFFGGSVVEAIYCGCHPLLPDRLAYPEHLDISSKERCFYETPQQAQEKLASLIASGAWRQASGLASQVQPYDWSRCIETYDRAFSRASYISSTT